MTEIEKMLAEQEYFINDPQLVEIRYQTRDKVDKFNQLSARNTQQKSAAIADIFSHVGHNVHIEQGLRVDYGCNTTLGNNVFINFNFIVLDPAPVTICDNVFIAPNVQLYTALHPLEVNKRATHMGKAHPIHIGNDVWIGGGSIILPGVTIGSGSTIGAGSVVNKDIPPHCVAAGNPCKVVRFLNAV